MFLNIIVDLCNSWYSVYMKQLSTVAIQVIKEKKGYSAVAVGLPGVCATEADTYEGVIKKMREAVLLHVEGITSIKKSFETSVVLLPLYA